MLSFHIISSIFSLQMTVFWLLSLLKIDYILNVKWMWQKAIFPLYQLGLLYLKSLKN